MQETLMTKLTAILVKNLPVSVEDIREESNFRTDLGADSLDLVEIIMAVENEFNVEISDDEITQINTVGNAISILEKKLR